MSIGCITSSFEFRVFEFRLSVFGAVAHSSDEAWGVGLSGMWTIRDVLKQDMERLVDGVEGAFPVGACPLLHGSVLRVRTQGLMTWY